MGEVIDAQEKFQTMKVTHAEWLSIQRGRMRTTAGDIETGLENMMQDFRRYEEGLLDSEDLLNCLAEHSHGVMEDAAILDTLTKQL